MSDSNADKQTIDDALIDYLFKKIIIDQTEKLALARISSKMGISSQLAEMSISRLSQKNLVRKIYLQGKVGFELTPRAKGAIEEKAKAETERITKQLQESIHQERKSNLRLSTFSKMKSIEDKWQTYQIPDRKQIDETEQNATIFTATTKEIKDKQPLCQVSLQNYDIEFLKYKPQIEKLSEQNNIILKAVNNYTKIKDYLPTLSTDIETIGATINKHEPITELASQVNQLKVALSKLKSIQTQLEDFDKNQLSRLEELKILLQENIKLFETLKKPTHEFMPIKRESLEKTPLYPDPEGLIKYGQKTSGYALEEKCTKCGIKRKSTSVNIG